MSTTHQHFVNLVNMGGGLYFTGTGKPEGADTAVAGSTFINSGDSAARPDGVKIGRWAVAKFDRGIDFSSGINNLYIESLQLDTLYNGFGLRISSANNSSQNITVGDCHITGNGDDGSFGIYMVQATNGFANVRILGNNVYEWGQRGIWLTGTITGAVVCNNSLWDVGQQTDDTYEAILMDTGVTGIVDNNYVNSNESNKHSYGVYVAADRSAATLRYTGTRLAFLHSFWSIVL